ncbi:MAG TPA: glycoside hydrolase family 3 N-terminal domain-containing protein [Actinoplanes sp.]|nr:glycoside hydrolase family 3 N-terminal domain-containing protein [Actinoplanes sp.]
MRARGAHVALVSTLGVLRDPRWGRAEETFGEDPEVAALFTTAVVRGMQGPVADERIPPDRLAVVLKHAAGQGATVGGRNWAATELGWRELAEIHLPPVRAAALAGSTPPSSWPGMPTSPCCAWADRVPGMWTPRSASTGLLSPGRVGLPRR